MESITGWQVNFLSGLALWVVISSILNVTQKVRSLTQPWVCRHVISGTPIVLKIQKYQNGHLDGFFSGLSCVVSVPFYTAFLPLLFWDLVSAPRPNSPPVRRVTATKDEEDNAFEYGLPSSHTLNTVCLSGFLLHYILTYNGSNGVFAVIVGFTVVCLFVGLIGLGRMYLGMHSLIDIIGGPVLGLGILAIWLSIFEYVDNFIVSGQNVVSFWTALSFLLIFAYPTPELPTPSFEYHTAFNGVALGIVTGVHQTFHQFHHENVARIFSPYLTIPTLAGRLLLGIPTILVVKLCSKALSKWILPILANTLAIPVR